MSLEFNRRSFLKYSAAAAVVVAGSGLLTGCGDDEYQPTGKLGSSLSLMGKYKLTPAVLTSNTVLHASNPTAARATVASTAPSSTASSYTLLCDLNLKCTSKYGLQITRDNFQVEVTQKGSSTTTTYHPGNSYNSTTQKGTGGVFLTKNSDYLEQDKTLKTTLVVENISLTDGATIKVKFWPRPQASEGTQSYTRAYCTWTLTVDKATTTGYIK